MASVGINGVGMTPFGRSTRSLPDLMADAAHAALAASGIEVPDAIVVATMNPEEFLGEGNFASRIALFWRRAGRRGDRVEAIARSWAKRSWKGWGRDTGQ